MAYIGREPTNTGEFLLIDDISGDFNGSDVSFTLQVGLLDVTPAAANTVIVLDGVVQEPTTAYSISGSTITFTEAPDNGLSFYGLLAGQSQYIANSSVTNDHISAATSISGSKISTDFSAQNLQITHITASGNISASGIVIADTFQSSGGSSDSISFTDDLNITGHITASGNISSSASIIGNTFTGTFNGALSSSAQIATTISGSRDAASISGSLGANAGVIRTLSAATVSGSFGNQRVGTTDDVKFANITGSNNISASGNLSITGNVDVDGTSNFAGNVTMQNDLVVTGRIDAEEIHTTFISSSIAQATGSTIFGDSINDSHQFTGSLDISGSGTVLRVSDGNVLVSDTLTATNIGEFSGTTIKDFTNLSGSSTATASLGSNLYVGGNITGSGGYFSGNIGIGTNVVTAPLTIEANGSHIHLDTPSSGQNNWITWKDNGSEKWEVNKDTSHNFNVYSYQASANLMQFLAAGTTLEFPTANFLISGSATTTGSFGGLQINNDTLVTTRLGNVGIGGTPLNPSGMSRTLELTSTSADLQLAIWSKSDSLSHDARIGELAFQAGSDSTLPTVASIMGKVSGSLENGGYITFQTRTTGDSGGSPPERMRIEHDGKVGIGTDNPGALLDVRGSLQVYNGSSYFFAGTGNTAYGLEIQANGTAYTGDMLILNMAGMNTPGPANGKFIRGKDGNSETLSIFGDGSVSGSSISTGSFSKASIGGAATIETLNIGTGDPRIRLDDSSGGYSIIDGGAGNLDFKVDGGAEEADSKFGFFLDGVAGANEKMVFNSTGLGIGFSTPADLLHVSGGDFQVQSTDPQILIKRSNSTSYAGHIDFANNAGTVGWQIGINQAVGNGIEFNEGDETNNRMYIESGGNVGIGTNSPTETLHVEGSASFGGNYIVNEQGTQHHTANTMPAPYWNFTGLPTSSLSLSSLFGGNYDIDNTDFGSVECLFEANKEASMEIISFGQTTNNSRNRIIYLKNTGTGLNHMYIDLEAANANKYRASGSINVPIGKPVHVVVTQDGTEPQIYVNGVKDTLVYNVTTDKTHWFNGTTNGWNTGYIGSHQSGNDPQGTYFQGQVYKTRFFNNALTEEEVRELHSGGGVPFKYQGATNTNFMTASSAATAGNESNTTGIWTARNAGVVTSDGTTWSGGDGSYSIKTVTDAGNEGVWGIVAADTYPNSVLENNTLEVGKSYRLTYTVKVTAGGCTDEIYSLSGGTNHGGTTMTTSGDGITTRTIDFTAEGTSLYFALVCSTANSTFFFDNWKLIQHGAVVEYDGSGISSDTWFDKSGNGLNATLVTGGYTAKIKNVSVAPTQQQVAFNVYPSSAQTNFAENSNVTVVWGSERFDVGSNFASNTFTAPVTGKYQLNCQLFLENIERAYTYYEMGIMTSNQNYYSVIDPDALDTDARDWCISNSVLADMDAGDTVYVIITAGGTSGGAGHDLSTQSWFSGYLI